MKKQPKTWSWILGGLVGVALVGLIIFLALAKEPGLLGLGGSPIRKFIFDFQTLIGGIFAIAAAYATVWQMRVTDERAEFRHAQQIALTIRKDGLKIDRAARPDVDELEAALENMRDVIGSFQNPDVAKMRLRDDLDFCLSGAAYVSERINRQAIQEAEELFDGDTMEHLRLARARAGEVMAKRLRITNYNQVTKGAEFPYSNGYYEQEVVILRESLEHLVDDVENFKAALQKIAGEYASLMNGGGH